MTQTVRENASFRDPSGFIFTSGGFLYRQIHHRYQEHYRHLMDSGLYASLVGQGLLVPHEEVTQPPHQAENVFKVIRPEKLSFISYPYEWCFSQLKRAALATLKIQKIAQSFGMWLKDTSAYNIQFRGNDPVLIDTLSFEKIPPGEPWPAYKQFCQHFLAPLSLACYRDMSLLRLLALHLDGIPLDLASRLLPAKTFFRFGLLAHLHLHARALQHWGGFRPGEDRRTVHDGALPSLIDSLESTIHKLGYRIARSRWAAYYQETNYSDAALEEKKKLIESLLEELPRGTVWDFGSNTGLFSRIAAAKGFTVFALDSDPVVVELHDRRCAKEEKAGIFPLVMDLTNPSPSLGWMSEERRSFIDRCHADIGLALALIHHLVIGNNLSFDQVAVFFKNLCRDLIIEFVAKEDSQVQSLLGCREDIFHDYRQEIFEKAFGAHFLIEKSRPIAGTVRTVYLMRRRPSG